MEIKTLKQAERYLGIKVTNIKYYFKQGVLKQRPDKLYYLDQQNLFRLKMIKILRSLNVDLKTIKEIFLRKIDFFDFIAKYEIKLKKEKVINKSMLECFQILKKGKLNDNRLNTIIRIIDKAPSKHFYRNYHTDYKALDDELFTRDYTFIVDKNINTAKEVMDILRKEAGNVYKEIEFINISLTPDFYLEGILYGTKIIKTTIRGQEYQKIYCYKEDVEKMGINALVVKESKFLTFLQRWWLVPSFIVIDLIIYIFLPFARHTSNLIILLCLVFLEIISIIIYLVYFNERNYHKIDFKI